MYTYFIVAAIGITVTLLRLGSYISGRNDKRKARIHG